MANVLVIDDDFLVAHLLKDHLTNEGHKVTTVHMAEEGFATAVKSPPDLIMLDVNLPDATGFQMCGRLRENPVTRAIPIVMMTGAARFPNQQAIGRQMGANEYILKPFNVVEVGDKIKSLIDPKHVVRMIETGDKVPAPREPEKRMDSTPIIEPAAAPRSNDHQNGKRLSRVPEFETMVDLLTRISQEPSSSPNITITKDHEDPPAPSPKTAPDAVKIPDVPAAAEIAPTTAPVSDVPKIFIPLETDASSSANDHSRMSLRFFGVLFVSQIGLSVATSLNQTATPADIVRNVTLVGGGWALILGLLVATCAFLRIELAPRLALQILGWAAIPIVLRSAGALVVASVPSLSVLHAAFDPAYLPTLVFWLRPLDIFEIASVTILGLSLRRRLGCSILKSLMAAAFIALAWSLAGRGYFQPF